MASGETLDLFFLFLSRPAVMPWRCSGSWRVGDRRPGRARLMGSKGLLIVIARGFFGVPLHVVLLPGGLFGGRSDLHDGKSGSWH
jgi:hypothetical protein